MKWVFALYGEEVVGGMVSDAPTTFTDIVVSLGEEDGIPLGPNMDSRGESTADRRLDQHLVDEVDVLVWENFSGVEAEWWWERRTDGGVTICQELDPEVFTTEIAEVFGLETNEVRRIAVPTLGLENFDPVVLVYELSGDTPADQAASALAERSSTAAGIAERIYRRLAGAMRENSTPRKGE